MEILYLLIPLSLVLAFAIGVAVWYAVEAGQFDDLDRPALDVVADDDKPSA
jgi:cbb3-type cytochrome oxidase maturation protein